MTKNKKILLALGSAVSITTPIVAVVSCGAKASSEVEHGKVLDSALDKVKAAVGAGAMFNMDDNGWFWTVGEGSKIDADRLGKFSPFDLGSVAVRKDNWDSIFTHATGSAERQALNTIFGGDANAHTVDYDLWNEGLKSPIVMQMLLDKVQKQVEDWYSAQPHKQTSLQAVQAAAANKYNEAKSWGTYFTNTFANHSITASHRGAATANDAGITHYNLLPTYTGQVDQLVALGIDADYYPLQLNENDPYAYLTNAGQFMEKQDDAFKTKIQNVLNHLTPSKRGTSWWNQQALEADEKGSDPAYWKQQEGGLLMYEHYLLDDDAKIIDSSIAPKHDPLATVQTNFRWSRDPFTRIPKAVFYGWGHLTDDELDALIDSPTATLPNDKQNITILGTTVTVTKHDALIIKSLKAKGNEALEPGWDGNSDWSFNDYNFVNTFHNQFLDNKQFQSSDFAKWIVDSTIESPFIGSGDATRVGASHSDELSLQLKQLFDASTYQADEINRWVGPRSSVAHAPVAPAQHTPHHPIYEQQEGNIGQAPMFEGAMRDNELYLFNVASQLDNIVTWGSVYGQSYYEDLKDTLTDAEQQQLDERFDSVAASKEEAAKVWAYLHNYDDDQVEHDANGIRAKANAQHSKRSGLTDDQLLQLGEAYEHANQISQDMHSRLAALKTYFEALKADAGKSTPLTYGLMTIAPGGQGQSTIQTMSKYSFLYKELGFAQPIPSNIAELAEGAKEFSANWKQDATGIYSNSYLS